MSQTKLCLDGNNFPAGVWHRLPFLQCKDSNSGFSTVKPPRVITDQWKGRCYIKCAPVTLQRSQTLKNAGIQFKYMYNQCVFCCLDGLGQRRGSACGLMWAGILRRATESRYHYSSTLNTGFFSDFKCRRFYDCYKYILENWELKFRTVRLFLNKAPWIVDAFFLKMKLEKNVDFSYDSDGRRDESVDSTFNAQVCVKTLYYLLLNYILQCNSKVNSFLDVNIFL